MVTSYQALRILAVHELGFGGSITDINARNGQTTVIVVTPVMRCTDTTVFFGSDEEMSMLMEFFGCYATVVRARDLNRMSQEVLDALRGCNTLLLVNLSLILIGSSEVFSALTIWAGLETQEQVVMARDVVAVNTRSGHSGLNELIEVIEFVRELGVPFEEAGQEVGNFRQRNLVTV